MSVSLLVLVLGLVGVGMVLTALVMTVTGHSARQRGVAAWLTTPGLLALGGALVVTAWLVPRLDGPTPEQDINRLLAQSPTAAGTAPPRFQRIGVRVDGTPSDRAEATPSERHAYSAQLAAALADAVVAAGISGQADARALTPESEAWANGEGGRQCEQHDLLVTVHMPAVRLPDRDDYALWREPSFELTWCHSGTVQSERFKVLERPGDRVPYEQAVRNRLLSLLRRTPKA